MALDRLDGPGIEPADVQRGAEGAILHVAPGAAGDLGDLGRVQRPPLLAVEFDQARERDVADVHVEAHADRIGRDQIVDLARLVERDLGVAGARAERAEHDRSPAPLPADQLGERIDVLGGERHHRAPARQPGNLGGRRVGQGGEPRPRDHLGLGHQLLQERPDRVGAEEHGLVPAARAQQPVGEHVAALGIGAELDLVDREEAGLEVLGHRLDGRDEIAGGRRLDPLFAGDQRGRGSALYRRRSGRRSRAPAGAADSRSGRFDGPTSARPRNGSCRCWSARARRARARIRTAAAPCFNYANAGRP